MMQFWLKSPLYDAAADGGGAGGGAGAADNSGVAKEDVAAMVNGLDKRFSKQFQTFEDTLKKLDGFAKAFGGVKPKKLAKLLARAGKGKNKGGDADGSDTGGESNNAGGDNAD